MRTAAVHAAIHWHFHVAEILREGLVIVSVDYLYSIQSMIDLTRNTIA